MNEKDKMMKKTYSKKSCFPWIFGVLALLIFHPLQAQTVPDKNPKKTAKETNKLLQNAEAQLGENDFPSAEASYREAISKNPKAVSAPYNMANMYYSKEKPSEATNRYKQAAKVAESKAGKHQVFHNLGNSYMEQKKYQQAVNAYEDALRNDPTDDQTRYNLALAKKMLEKQKKNNKGGGNNKNQDQNKDKNKKDQDKKNQGDKNKKDNKQGDNKKQDQGGDKKDDSQKQPKNPDDKGQPKDQKKQQGKNGDDKEKQPPQQPQQGQHRKGQLSPQQIKSLLEAMNNEEKKVQDKINAHKVKGAKTKTDKDW